MYQFNDAEKIKDFINQIDDIERNERKASKFFSKQLLSWFWFMLFLSDFGSDYILIFMMMVLNLMLVRSYWQERSLYKIKNSCIKGLKESDIIYSGGRSVFLYKTCEFVKVSDFLKNIVNIKQLKNASA
ncbi:MAG: hypothetical protein HRT38_03935 [Alteromonadaceae bacterium]|nr:hypothetical protein [Alteromonadaceae bacterium]